ncbi:potassium voltage-gated channel subfamily C member 2-like [Lineus longissimus]|uniref:potassium voltage-gated channel subfamily C member 2-like n=1 Tax=Lineus longissimus TaxID=88925 RepID=UPI00315D653D
MEFWNIPQTMIASCCVGKIAAAESEKTVEETVRREILWDFEKSLKMYEDSIGWKKAAARLWIMLEFPCFCKTATMWSIFMSLMVVLSTLTLMLNFDTTLRERLDLPENRTNDSITMLVGSEKWHIFFTTIIRFEFLILDVNVNFIILVDFIVRVIVCPYKIVYLKSGKTLYGLIILTFWATVIFAISPHVSGSEPSVRIKYVWLASIGIQLLRPVLLLRLSNGFVGLKVLLMVLTKSVEDFMTIVAFLCIGTLFFAIFIYAAEIALDGSFTTPWQGCWWAMVTMSTVGYGDMYPQTSPGYCVGVLCALSGVIITGLSIPILSNNFSSYYRHVHLAMARIRKCYPKVHHQLDHTITVAEMDKWSK